MTRYDEWYSERPHRSPAEYACLLANDRFWRDERLRLIGSHREFPDAATILLKREPSLAHALVLVLSRLPKQRRRSFADAFYEGARRQWGSLDVDTDNLSDPDSVATGAVLEVLDPSSDVVALQEVLARVAFAAVETWSADRVLEFLLKVDRLFAEER